MYANYNHNNWTCVFRLLVEFQYDMLQSILELIDNTELVWDGVSISFISSIRVVYFQYYCKFFWCILVNYLG